MGAWISVWRPVEIDAQPPTWAGVGVSNADSNQARTAGEKGASGSPAEAFASFGSACATAPRGGAGGRCHGSTILRRPHDFEQPFDRFAAHGQAFGSSPSAVSRTLTAVLIARSSSRSSAVVRGTPALGSSSNVVGIGDWP